MTPAKSQPQPHNSPTSLQAGFTLLEVTISLLILSSIAVVMSGFLSQLKRLDQQTESMLADQNVSATLSYIANTISSAQKTPFRFSKRGLLIIFRGSAEQVEFVGPVRIQSNKYALRKVTFSYNENSKEVLQSTSAIFGSEDSRSDRVNLYRGLARLRFRYLNRNNTWTDTWEQKAILPLALEISYSERENDVVTRLPVIFSNALPLPR